MQKEMRNIAQFWADIIQEDNLRGTVRGRMMLELI